MERIKKFSTQVWNLMTQEEQDHFYHDVGMTDFVELTSKLLHLEPPTGEALYDVLYELHRPSTEDYLNLDYIRDQIFNKAAELDDEDLSGLGCMLDEYIKGAKTIQGEKQ